MKPARLVCVILAVVASTVGQSSPAHQSPNNSHEVWSKRSATPQTATPQPVSSLASGLSFTGPRYFDAGGLSTNAVAVADLNGDGKLDAIALSWCLNFSSCTPQGVAV